MAPVDRKSRLHARGGRVVRQAGGRHRDPGAPAPRGAHRPGCPRAQRARAPAVRIDFPPRHPARTVPGADGRPERRPGLLRQDGGRMSASERRLRSARAAVAGVTIKQILCPTDFSEASTRALHHASAPWTAPTRHSRRSTARCPWRRRRRRASTSYTSSTGRWNTRSRSPASTAGTWPTSPSGGSSPRSRNRAPMARRQRDHDLRQTPHGRPRSSGAKAAAAWACPSHA